jgi:hypothetical protein
MLRNEQNNKKKKVQEKRNKEIFFRDLKTIRAQKK